MPLSAALAAIGDPGPVHRTRAVGGGCISRAQQIVTARGRYFLKTGASRTFEVEARGLALLRAAEALPIPRVLAVDDGQEGQDGYLLLEWVEPATAESGWGRRLGQGLAALHREVGASFGLDHDNFIGANPQSNGWDVSWIDFYRDQRLRAQESLAEREGRWSATRRKRLDRICDRLEALIGTLEAPALLHGDLWSGNVLLSAHHGPMLIDPAVYYGDPEADIAMTTLFGGFPRDFYDAYGDLRPGWETRRDLYNLYHLMNHLNLFGEGYGGQVDAILGRYS